jgi:hypothetical protein
VPSGGRNILLSSKGPERGEETMPLSEDDQPRLDEIERAHHATIRSSRPGTRAAPDGRGRRHCPDRVVLLVIGLARDAGGICWWA